MPSSTFRRRRDHSHDTTWDSNEFRFKPRILRQCVRMSLQRPLSVEGTNTTETCMDTTATRSPLAIQERQLRREELFVELEQFKICLCDIHRPTRHCNFHMRHIIRNDSILESCLSQRQFDGRLQTDTQADTHFACDLIRGRRITCRQSHVSFTPKQTRFQHILDCLTNGVQELQCPVTTTFAPAMTTTPAPGQTKVLVLSMAIVISLLLGALGTWLGIFCWRRKRRRNTNRTLPTLLTKLEHGSQPNLYEGDYTEDHIYDIVKSDGSPRNEPVPDLLSRVPSLPPMTNRTPRWKMDDADNVTIRSIHGENYEPLLRHKTSPATDSTNLQNPEEAGDMTSIDYLPLLPDRSGEISINVNEPQKRVHPYDLVDESLVGLNVDESQTEPKIVHSPASTSQRAGGNDYFVLEEKARNASEGEHKELDTRTSRKGDATKTGSDVVESRSRESEPNTPSVANTDAIKTEHTTKSNEPNIDAAKQDTSTDNINTESGQDWDGYEVPVTTTALTPPFDIASSFEHNVVSDIGRKGEKDDVVDV